jgi:phage baseplate assembly protein W
MPFEQKVVQDFIGKGITFPIQLVNGKPPIETGFQLIRASIRNILGWPYGQRFFLTEFGSRLQELIEEPNDYVLKNLINTFVVDAITDWEKRIQLIDAQIENQDGVKINIRLVYRIVNSQQVDNFIFPFYRQITK